MHCLCVVLCVSVRAWFSIWLCDVLLCMLGVISVCRFIVFFFQAEDGIRDLVRSRGLGDVYKRQSGCSPGSSGSGCSLGPAISASCPGPRSSPERPSPCLLYTSDAADERSSVDLGGRRIIKKKKHHTDSTQQAIKHSITIHHHVTPSVGT